MYVVYDGDCGFCQWFIDQFASDGTGDIAIPAKHVDRYPEISALLARHNVSVERCAQAIVAVSAQEVLYGHSVINRILRGRGGVWKAVAALEHFPLIDTVERACYAAVATQRGRISRLLGLSVCKL